jgi:protein ImuB
MSRVRKFPASARVTPPVTLAKGSAEPRQASLPLAKTATRDRDPRPTAASSRQLWFCVYLPSLPLEACGNADAPLAVVEDRQGVSRVLQANEPAMAAGIAAGQTSNAALALLPEIVLEERSRLREQQALERLAAWLERFSSFVSIAAGDVLLLEIAGSLKLFGGLRELRQQLSAGLREQGFGAALSIAPTPLAATWLARGRQRVCIRNPANLAGALRALPVTCAGWPAATIESLAGMGIKTVGECLRLPREGFARRFGAARLLELDRALGRLPDPRAGWRAPEYFRADHEMFEEQSDQKVLLDVCAELLRALERFLLVRQLGIRRLEFVFYHLRANATTLTLGCIRADRSAESWKALLGLRFEQLQLPEAVIAIRLEGGHPEALHTGSARLAFERCDGEGPRYSMLQLAERLAARVGYQSVLGLTCVADHRPQYAWGTRNLLARKVGEALALVRRSLHRPLWMLPEPVLLDTDEGGYPVHFGRLRLLEGPERLETGWWDDYGIARDYYTAINSRGVRLWIFRDRSSRPDWYLHGYFG